MKTATLLAAVTAAALAVLVALPVAGIVLQAIFPHLGEDSLRTPFGAWRATLSDPELPALLGSTLRLGLGTAAIASLAGIPLGALRGLFRLPLTRL